MLKEYVSSAISMITIGLLSYVIVVMFTSADHVSADAYTKQSDLLKVLLGLAGTVMGYYFGRIPAENHANAAQANATNAQAAAQQAQAKLAEVAGDAGTAAAGMKQANDAKDKIIRGISELRSTLRSAPLGGAEPGSDGFLAELDNRLESLIREAR